MRHAHEMITGDPAVVEEVETAGAVVVIIAAAVEEEAGSNYLTKVS